MNPNKKTFHVGAPNMGDRNRLKSYVDEIYDRRWLTNHGALVQELEQKLVDYLGVKHCICVCNGTIALEIAVRALDLKGEVIIPSLTFIATAHALQWQGITPVFCDINQSTYCIDPEEVEKHISPKTTAIMGVHLYSRPCDIEALQAIADQHGIKLLFDAAHAFGCSHNGTMIGNFGECEVFSFHATKFFNTFEGGAIATNDDDLAEKIRFMQDFGYRETDNVVSIGTNGKMNEICAAMGLVNLEHLNEYMNANKKNYHAYKNGLANIPGIKLIEFSEKESCNRQYIIIEISDVYPLSRDDLLGKLHAENILARRYFWPPCHQMEPYKTLQPNVGNLLKTSEKISHQLLALPTGTAIDFQAIELVISLIKNSRNIEDL